MSRAGVSLVALLLVAALAGLWFACSRSAEQSPATGKPASAPSGLAADERIAFMLAGHNHTEPYLADTSDLVPALVSKLAHGQSDPMAQAKVDLANSGERALPELKRFFDANYSNEAYAARLINALDTASMMTSGLGHPILLRGLDHPVGSVRLAALRGMGKQALPEDFDRLKMIASVTGSEGHAQLAAALWCSDPARVVRELQSWAESGAMPGQVILPLGPKLAKFKDSAALLTLKPLVAKVSGEFHARLLGALAKAGDAESLEELRTLLADPIGPRREIAAHALRDCGLQRELVRSLREDGDAAVRLVAVLALSELPMDEELRGLFLSAAGDPADDVRGQALTALIAAGDAQGENEAFALLKGDRSEVERGLLVLRDTLPTRRDLAERTLAILDGLRTGTITPLRVEKSTLWRAIAQVPLEAAARILFDEMEHQPSPDKGFSASRWFTTQIGNTGPEGWRLLRQRWASESDPERRVDLMNASCYDRGDDSRKFLEDALDGSRMTPLEVLYAAQLLAQLGPAGRVAPRLKRVALGINDRAVRPALNNMLWTWYGLEP